MCVCVRVCLLVTKAGNLPWWVSTWFHCFEQWNQVSPPRPLDVQSNREKGEKEEEDKEQGEAGVESGDTHAHTCAGENVSMFSQATVVCCRSGGTG